MGVNFTGDWDKFLKLGNIERNLRKHMGDALEIAAETLKANVMKGIRDQKWSFAPLSPKTLDNKKKKGSLILINEGDYLASFATERIDWDEVQVGSNYPQARALEFGYEPRNLPARPHVAPALEESAEEILDILGGGLAGCFKAMF